MSRQIICDICDVTYTDKRESHPIIVELRGKLFKVYVDVSSADGPSNPDYYHLDVCSDCKKQALSQLVEKWE